MISSLRPNAEPYPFLGFEPNFDHLKLMATSAFPPPMTIESFPTISAFCFESL